MGLPWSKGRSSVSGGAELQFRNAPQTTWQALLIDRHELQEVATILTGRPLELPERGTSNFKASDQASGLTSVIQVALSDLASLETPGVPAAASLCEEIVNEFVRATANTDESAHNR